MNIKLNVLYKLIGQYKRILSQKIQLIHDHHFHQYVTVW